MQGILNSCQDLLSRGVELRRTYPSTNVKYTTPAIDLQSMITQPPRPRAPLVMASFDAGLGWLTKIELLSVRWGENGSTYRWPKKQQSWRVGPLAL